MRKTKVEEQLKNGRLQFPDPLPALRYGFWSAYRFNDTHLPEPGAEFRYIKVDLPLFSYAPEFSDIRQEGVGDCYLLSAINAAIRTKDADFFYSMMGGDDEHVHVRFNDGKGSQVIVSVQRTILKRLEGKEYVDIQGHSAIWPYFIEKAYAYFRAYYIQPLFFESLIDVPVQSQLMALLSRPFTNPPTLPPWPFPGTQRPSLGSSDKRYASNYIEAVEGGFTGAAYTHLTGALIDDSVTVVKLTRPGRSKLVVSEKFYRANILACFLDETRPNPFGEKWDAVLGHILSVLKRDIANLVNPENVIDFKIEHKNEAVDQIRIYMLKSMKLNRKLIDNYLSLVSEQTNLGREIRKENLLKLIDNMKFEDFSFDKSKFIQLNIKNINIKSIIIEYINLSFPGKRGTGEYADYQSRIFDAIKNAVGEIKTGNAPVIVGLNKAAFAATRKYLRSVDIIFYKYEYHNKRKGLVPGHAYEIEGVQEMDVVRNGKIVKLKFIHVINPWRDYVRGYKYKTAETDGVKTVTSLSAFSVKMSNDLPEDSLLMINFQARGLESLSAELKNISDDLQKNASQTTKKSDAFPIELSDITKYFDSISIEK
ncbi:hypothetical protein [Ancylobacter vacuolatus]|uniref:Calpain catalytic domain-containing protein n=1 Tax=Ancylobacter vacuolatus TaxID=223389 RepID=A0ABU0DI98_9HYPH|nr:hypothetical protein [Ancylobacter vacuolatus]MDQ0348154.1 hypothetical protein [Ancylobacter vacuolatus]